MEPKDEIKQKLDIAEVIGEYLQLKRSGSGLMAVCPFHAEKTPSFHVSPEKQIWHCFGCGEGGDLFSFVMQMEGIDFPEALRILGKRAGVEIPRYSSAQSNERERLVEANELAAKFYNKVLLDSTQAVAARDYLAKRGVTEELIDSFELGFAPDAWDTLVTFLVKRGFSAREIVSAGLGQPKKSGSGLIDRFRNRVMVPLRDAHGNAVAFTGRVLDPHGIPKYMNSPETPVYKKGELLFGLDLAKRAVKDAKAAIIVEGNLDVVASHKAGIANVVASSGTALTDVQLQLLKRYTDRVVFCFDQDAAGFEAAKRGIHAAERLGLTVEVVLLPEAAGKDPDEAVQKDPKLWTDAVAHPIPIMQYFLERSVRDRDLARVEDKKQVWEFLAGEIAQIPDVISREHWLQTVSDLVRVDIHELRADVVRRSAPAEGRGQGGQPTPGTAGTAEKPTHMQTKPHKKSRAELAAEALLAILFNSPDLRQDALMRVSPEWIPEGDLRELYMFFVVRYNSAQQSPPSTQTFFADFCSALTDDQQREHLMALAIALGLSGEALVADLSAAQVRTQLNEHIDVLQNASVQSRRKALEADIRLAESRGDHETVKRLLHEYNSLR